MCPVKHHCGPDANQTQVDPPSSPAPVLPGFGVESEGARLFADPGNLRFGRNTSSGVVPAGVATRLDELAAYLKSHPDVDLEITGLFGSAEAASDSFRNLGLARAALLFDEMQKRGTDAAHLIRSYEQQADSVLAFVGDTLVGGAWLKLVPRLAHEEAPAPEPRNLYFETGSDQLVMTDSLRAYLTSVIQYQRSHDKALLSLTGHTDNQGAASANKILGMSRAKTVATYFNEFGLASDRISLSSKGAAEPIVPNNSPENMAQNRRVEIRLK